MLQLRFGVLISLILALTGCTATYDGGRVAYVGFKLKSSGKRLGQVQGEDCGTAIFGIGKWHEYLSYDQALSNLLKQYDLSYLVNANFHQKGWFVTPFVTHSCFVVTGEAYK